MGGYSGKAVACFMGDASGRKDGCWEIFVWHDGEFPFSEEHTGSPARLHHCDAHQFIDFGETLLSLTS